MAGTGLGKKLDNAHDEQSMRRLIEDEEKSALRNWVAVRMSEGQPAADRWLLERIYKIVRVLERKGLADVLGARIAELHVRHRGQTSINDQPFKQALFIFAGQIQRHGPAPFKRQRRYEWSDALAFAYSQNVKGADVIKFIEQRGMKNCHLAWKKVRNQNG